MEKIPFAAAVRRDVIYLWRCVMKNGNRCDVCINVKELSDGESNPGLPRTAEASLGAL